MKTLSELQEEMMKKFSEELNMGIVMDATPFIHSCRTTGDLINFIKQAQQEAYDLGYQDGINDVADDHIRMSQQLV